MTQTTRHGKSRDAAGRPDFWTHRKWMFGFVFALVPLLRASGLSGTAPTLPVGKSAVAPAAPSVAGDVVNLLQERKYESARDALQRLKGAAKDQHERAYYGYLQAIAERLGGLKDEARATLSAAAKDDPGGPWTSKIEFELSALILAAGQPAAAEELARSQAIRLLAGDRKDRLAEIYHAFARKLLDPEDPVVQSDPNGAWELLNQARELAKSESLRASLLVSMGRASLRGGDVPRAIQHFQAYLAEYPKGADRLAVRFELGVAQRQAGQLAQARLTWTDLARDIERRKPDGPDQAAQDLRARALAEIPSTHGVPNPPDDTNLNLGVAALQRFLTAYPAHSRAVRAAYDIGASYRARGKSDQALAAFSRFLKDEGFKAETEEARRDHTELAMTATFQYAQILQHQRKFAEAIAAWKGYLANFPNGPQSADAQREILSTQLLIAADHQVRGRYPEARAAWKEYAAQNPLDPNVPTLLFRVGESLAGEKKFDEAIAAWGPLTSKFPAHQEAAHAQFMIALIFETEKGDPAGAIERFRAITTEPWKSQALMRIDVMESLSLSVLTPRTFRTGETALLEITTRNLEKLTFTAYKLNAEAYFRKKHLLSNVEALDIGLVAPDAEWTADVPGYAKYRPVQSRYELKKLEQPGVYVVKVTDQKHLQATTLVLSSDLEAIVKTSRDQVLVFAQDMKTGKGRPKARVLMIDGGQVVLESETGPDGALLHNWSPQRNPKQGLTYLILDGGHVASSGLSVPVRVAQGLTPRAYLYTDRPAYRPGQQVSVRGVVREIHDGQYAHVPGANYRFEVADSRGRQLVVRGVTLSEFGTFHEVLPLESGAPVGTYRVRVYQPGKSDFSGTFEVQSYQLQPIDLKFDLKKTVFYRGETIEADAVARYQYGAPVANRPIEVVLPDQRVLNATTDAAGKFHVSFPTEGFAEEQALRLVARLPQDNVATAATVMLAIRGFNINVTTRRDVFLDGESFQVRLGTTDARGEPIGQTLRLAVVKQINQAGEVTERESEHKTVETDPKTGQGAVSFRIDDEQGGNYLLRATGTDRFGNPIVTDKPVYVSGKRDENKLRILADRQQFKLGEEASVNLHSRGRAGMALLTWEADRILSYRIVTLNDGDNPIGWAVEGPQFPNFTLNAARMWRNQFDQASLDIQVDRGLKVTVTPVKSQVEPGEDVELEVTAADQLGRPVAAEVAIAMTDRSLLRIFADRLPEIGQFFYSQSRTGAFSTEATNTFRYAPATVPVAQAVVDEAERMAAVAANQAGKGAIIRDLKDKDVAMFAPPEAIVDGNSVTMLPGAAAVGGAGLGGGAAGMGGMMREMMGRNPAQAGDRQQSASGPVLGKRLYARTPELARRQAGAIAGDVAFDEAAGAAENAPREAEELGLRKSDTYWGFETNRGRGRGKEKAAAESRSRFAETAYWNPSVVTGKDGKAKVTFKAPSALSEYRISVRGVTGADTLVGQTDTSLTVRTNFLVDLKAPAALTQGDKPRFVASVHHLGLKGTVELKLAVYSGGRDEVFPRTIEVAGDGVDEVLFDPFEVPDADSVRLTLTGTLGTASDQLTLELPVRPWGVQAYASASGTSSDGTAVFVGLPKGRAYENPEMMIVISPTLARMIVELALGRDEVIFALKSNCRIFPPPSNTTADRAADLLAATSALNYLRASRTSGSSDTERLSERIQGLVAELISTQNEDGGWPWIRGGVVPRPAPDSLPTAPSDRLASAAALWALATAEPLGLLPDPRVADRAVAWLSQAAATGVTNVRDRDARAILLHALSTRKAATFEMANTLNRERQALSSPALAYLALTFANLGRPELAGEVVSILIARAKTEPAAPGRRARLYWEGSTQSAGARDTVETTALASLAIARVRPQAGELEQAVDWLHAHRFGHGWNPHRAKGAAIAALALFHGRARGADDRYRLTLTVNDTRIDEINVEGSADSRVIPVQLKALKAEGNNRVALEMQGRGTFSYAVTMTGFTRDFGPDQDRANRPAWVDRRVYWPAPPELDGKVLPVGFGVAVNPSIFENVATQTALGGKARVGLVVWRNVPGTTPEWERDALVVEERLPAGTTLIEGSVQTSATSYSLADGVLTFYYAPGQNPGSIQYDVYGFLPGQYRTLPASVRSVDESGRFHLGQAGEFRVLSPGEKNTDPYRPSPDELYARGKAHFDAGRLDLAMESLEPLFSAYNLRDDVAKDAARILLLISIKDYDARKVVQYFEVVKEKSPELVLSFDQLQVIARAYRDINEYERAIIVWKGLIESSYLEDARVGELLRQRGRTLEALAYLIDLWRGYPNTPSIESDFFGLSQLVTAAAGKAFTDPNLRRELATAGVTRTELLAQSIRMIQVFLSQSPTNPVADEASLALLGNLLELEDFETVVKLAGRYAAFYPKSTYQDSFLFSEALANFQLGRHERAVEVAEKISRAVYKDAAGVEQPSPNKWQALYILGQIHDARREPAKAIAYYRQVEDRFTDAASAILFYTRKDLKVPEVSVVRPQVKPALADGFRAVEPQPGQARVAGQPERQPNPGVTLEYRNIAKADVTVYPVDLMQLYLTRRNLNAIAGIDLAGITPLVEKTVSLGDGSDYDDRSKFVDLPLTKEGAYLVMIRGENLYASGIVLVTPLELEVLEEPVSSRVRIGVRDARSKALTPKVQVKVIGSGNGQFFSGETDPRGSFIAEGVQGLVTVVVRKGTTEYAFYRGVTPVGSPPTPPPPRQSAGQSVQQTTPPQPEGLNQALDANLRMQNSANELKQIQRLEQRYQKPEPGQAPGAPAGIFR